jgi:hypothetical protein
VFGGLLDGVLLGAAATRTKKPEGLAAVFAAGRPARARRHDLRPAAFEG